MLSSQKMFLGPLSNGHFQRRNAFASVTRVGQFKHGKLRAFTNYRKVIEVKVIYNHRVRTKKFG